MAYGPESEPIYGNQILVINFIKLLDFLKDLYIIYALLMHKFYKKYALIKSKLRNSIFL